MELGKDSIDEHKAIVQLIERYSWKSVALVGGDFKSVDHPYVYFDTADACSNWIAAQNFRHCYFLIKGSRSIQLENVLKGFKN